MRLLETPRAHLRRKPAGDLAHRREQRQPPVGRLDGLVGDRRDPGVDERTVAPSIEKFLDVIRKSGGEVENVDIWGKRRLAYDINKRSEGYYAVVNMTTTPADAQELDRQLTLSESVLRTKLLRPDAK